MKQALIQKKYAGILDTIQQAKVFAGTTDDELNTLTLANIRLTESMLFESLVLMNERLKESNPEELFKALILSARAISDLSKSAVLVGSYRMDMRERVARQMNKMDKMNRKGGMSAEMWETLRREFLGITDPMPLENEEKANNEHS